jgi:predicted amidohydrolase
MTAARFKAAMIQMRSGLAPAANLDAAVTLIGEAKSAGVHIGSLALRARRSGRSIARS